VAQKRRATSTSTEATNRRDSNSKTQYARRCIIKENIEEAKRAHLEGKRGDTLSAGLKRHRGLWGAARHGGYGRTSRHDDWRERRGGKSVASTEPQGRMHGVHRRAHERKPAAERERACHAPDRGDRRRSALERPSVSLLSLSGCLLGPTAVCLWTPRAIFNVQFLERIPFP